MNYRGDVRCDGMKSWHEITKDNVKQMLVNLSLERDSQCKSLFVREHPVKGWLHTADGKDYCPACKPHFVRTMLGVAR